MKTQNKYVPGVCNIGTEEIKRRKQVGWIGLITTVVLWTLFIKLDIPSVWQLTLFFPAIMSATGFLQAYMHFCAYFGFASLFNFSDLGKTDTVQQTEFRVKDRRRAWQIIIYSILISLVVTLIAYGLL